MTLATLAKYELIHALKHQGLRFQVGAFSLCLTSPIPEVATHLLTLYGAFNRIDDTAFIDFHTSLAPPSRLRRYVHPQVNFAFDGYFPFKPLPYAQAAAMFEWGLNWCIASQAHQYLISHAAVVERNDRAFIFPATTGSGKSTLCAALVGHGWRLLSDEMALLSLADGLIYPVPRPISLKNQSIDIIRSRYPDMVIGQRINDTVKGVLAHVRPPASSVAASSRAASATQVIFPRYQAAAQTQLEPISKARALLKMAENSFNYNILGTAGFNSLADLINHCDCYNFSYSCLDEALDLLTELAQ